MKLTVSMPQFSALNLRVGYLKKAAASGLKLGVSEAAGLFEAEAKLIVPVDTGRLRDSIATEVVIDSPEKQERQVAPHTEYAGYVEYGTSRQRPQPYIRPAFDTQKADAAAAIKDSVVQALDDASNKVAAKRRR